MTDSLRTEITTDLKTSSYLETVAELWFALRFALLLETMLQVLAGQRTEVRVDLETETTVTTLTVIAAFWHH